METDETQGLHTCCVGYYELQNHKFRFYFIAQPKRPFVVKTV